MTAARYLAIVGPTDLLRVLKRRIGRLTCVVDKEHLLVWAANDAPILGLGDQGVILGEMFDRGMKTPVAAISDDDRQAIVASGGKRLVERYWGGWIAMLGRADGPITHIVRAPLGDMPCIYRHQDGALMVASDRDLLDTFEQSTVEIDWAEVTRHLAAPDVRRSPTCIKGISELQGGDRLSWYPHGLVTDHLWSPWQFASDPGRPQDLCDARSRVRDAINLAVAARSAAFSRVLLRLSGGLDSSIVAAALAKADRRFVALNMVTEDRAGDEREFARRVATSVGCTLVERFRSVATIDPTISLAAGQSRPSTRLFMQDSIVTARAVAVEHGADIVFDGGGGDNVFSYLPSVSPVIDRIRSDGIGWPVIQSALDVSMLNQTPLGNVLRQVVRRMFRRSPRYRWRPNVHMLSVHAETAAATATDHPWLDCPDGAQPGKAGHIALLVSAQSWVEALDARAFPRSISPLLAQPVVEACLSIPSWHWIEGGVDRAIAREAFRPSLPREIVERRGKGAPDSFLAQIVETHGSTIKELLMDGRLVKHGVIDRKTVSAALHDTRFLQNYDFLRLLQLVDAEAWAMTLD
jgi:asparagine synthase (glutamine-hydrolysing)